MTPASNGYSGLSIALHWIAAIAVVLLFVTHEGDRGSTQYAIHVGLGSLLGLAVLWRVLRRPLRGFAPKPDQPVLLNLVSTLVLWAMLPAMLAVFLTGYFLPWSVGAPLDILGLIEIPSPLARSRDLHEAIEEIHDFAGHALVPLVILHVLGALKHAIIDRDHVLQRMIRAERGGH